MITVSGMPSRGRTTDRTQNTQDSLDVSIMCSNHMIQTSSLTIGVCMCGGGIGGHEIAVPHNHYSIPVDSVAKTKK